LLKVEGNEDTGENGIPLVCSLFLHEIQKRPPCKIILLIVFLSVRISSVEIFRLVCMGPERSALHFNSVMTYIEIFSCFYSSKIVKR
jgi:hypothetical protein